MYSSAVPGTGTGSGHAEQNKTKEQLIFYDDSAMSLLISEHNLPYKITNKK
jgi:hypothetical protein